MASLPLSCDNQLLTKPTSRERFIAPVSASMCPVPSFYRANQRFARFIRIINTAKRPDKGYPPGDAWIAVTT